MSENTVADAIARGVARMRRRAASTGQLAQRGMDRQHVCLRLATTIGAQANTRR
jgi:hypothetical protein